MSNFCCKTIFTLLSQSLFAHLVKIPCKWPSQSCKYWWVMATNEVTRFIKHTGYTLMTFWQSVLFGIIRHLYIYLWIFCTSPLSCVVLQNNVQKQTKTKEKPMSHLVPEQPLVVASADRRGCGQAKPWSHAAPCETQECFSHSSCCP